nr:transposase (putative), gypsy type [Tanacetum cinerariifolium]
MGGARKRAYAINGGIWYSVVSSKMNQLHSFMYTQVDSLKNWNNRFFWVYERVFPTAVEWRTNASKDGMPASGTYSVEAVRALDTHRTPIQKQPEALLCLVGISRRYYLGDDVYPTFQIDLFGLIRAPNPTKMDEPALATDSSGVPSAIEKSPLGFADEAEASGRETAAHEVPPSEEVPLATVPGAGQAVKAVVAEPPTVRESRKRGLLKVLLLLRKHFRCTYL